MHPKPGAPNQGTPNQGPRTQPRDPKPRDSKPRDPKPRDPKPETQNLPQMTSAKQNANPLCNLIKKMQFLCRRGGEPGAAPKMDPKPGTLNQASQTKGSKPRTPHQGAPNQRTPNQGTPNQGTGPKPRHPKPETPNQGTPYQEEELFALISPGGHCKVIFLGEMGEQMQPSLDLEKWVG